MLSDRSLLGCTLSDFVDGNLFELAHRFFWISDATMGLFLWGFFMVLSSPVVFVLPAGSFRRRA